MIIQCDQCKTRFRLDDSRVTDAGVKVRCSRCKNTFVVKKKVNEEVAGPLEASKGSENPALETGNRHGTAANLQTGQKVALPGEESEIGRESGYSSNSDSPPVGAADNETANEGNDIGFNGFDSDWSTFAEMDKKVESMPVENKEKHGACAGAELSDWREKDLDEGDTGSIRLGVGELSGESSKEVSAVDFSESPDFSNAPGDVTGQSVGSEPASNQSWDIFSPASGPEAETLDEAGKEFLIDWQEQDTENAGVISAKKDDYGILSPDAEPVKTDMSADHIVSAAEPEKGDVPSLAQPGYPDEENNEEDLPPLAITSRKKKSLFSPVAVAILLLAVIAAGGAAYYFSWIDFSSLNIPALSGAVGKSASSTGGELVIKNLDGFYIRNVHGGEMLVVTGESFNQSGKALSSVGVRGYIYGKKGEVLLSRHAKFFNTLSRDQLTTLPVSEIEAILKNDPGKSPADNTVQPGTAASFQIVFTHVPEGAGEFGAEVTGSKVSVR